MMVMLRAMVLGRLGGLFTPIHERVLYPSHRLGGGVSKGESGKGHLTALRLWGRL